jgi:hypothetical protein
MKRVLTFLLIGAILAVANAQAKTDKEQSGLLGPVHTVKTEVVELTSKHGKSVEGARMPGQMVTYDALGNRVKRVDFNSDSSVSQTLVYTYDAEGRGTGFEEYAGTLSTPRQHLYSLNDKGNRIEYRIVQPDGAAGEKYLYKYDLIGNQVAEALYDHKGRLISRSENTFANDGSLISQLILNGDGSVSSTSNNSNDPDGKPLERIRYEGHILTYKLRYTYDSKRRLVGLETVGSFVETDVSGSETHVTGKVVYLYKGKEQPKESVTYNPDGSFRERVVFVYDSRGNWIKKTHLVQVAMKGKEIPRQTEYRTITYHHPERR